MGEGRNDIPRLLNIPHDGGYKGAAGDLKRVERSDAWAIIRLN